MPADKPRAQQNTHDLLLSLAPLVLIILAMAGLARACTFSPGGPSEAAPPSIDLQQAITRDAAEVDFSVRLPELPQGWVANSGDVRAVGPEDEAVRTGFVTDSGGFLRLVQSSAEEDPLVAEEAGGARTASSAVDVAGASWVVYNAEDGAETVWVTSVADGTDEVRLLVTGSGSVAEFRALAEAAVQGQPVLV